MKAARILPLVTLALVGCLPTTAPVQTQAPAPSPSVAVAPTATPVPEQSAPTPPAASPTPAAFALPAPAEVGRFGTKGHNYFTFRYPLTWQPVDASKVSLPDAVVVVEAKSGKGLLYVQEVDATELELDPYYRAEELTAGASRVGAVAASVGGFSSYVVASKQTLGDKPVTMMASGVLIIPALYPTAKAKVYRIVCLAEGGAPETAEITREYAYMLSSWQWADMLPIPAIYAPRPPVSGGAPATNGASCIEISAAFARAERGLAADFAARGAVNSAQHEAALKALNEERVAAMAGCK